MNAGAVDNAHVDRGLLARYFALAAAHPADLFRETSGHRDHDVSAADSYSGVAAPAGRSNHRLDPSPVLDTFVNGRPIAEVYSSEELARFGLWTHVKGDPIHLATIGVYG